jgi:malate synthase
LREDVQADAAALLAIHVPGGQITEVGVRGNISVALQYLNSWLLGNGAAAIYNLMEDAATAEISRAQLWQWSHHGARLDDGRPVDAALYEQIRDEELAALGGADAERYGDAAAILDGLILNGTFLDFLTIPAYEYLD